jgi:hypothetical protein
MPLLPIHRAISGAKRTELARLDATVATLNLSPPPDDAALSRLMPILAYRSEIESASDWPFDTGVTGRLAFYLIIPPFTWAGAAVIQHFVDVAL